MAKLVLEMCADEKVKKKKEDCIHMWLRTSLIAMSLLLIVSSTSFAVQTADAGPADYYFFLGEWTLHDSNALGDYKITMVFEVGGEGTSVTEWDYGSTTTTTEGTFEWKVEEDQICIKDEGASDWSQMDYEFESFYSEVYVNGDKYEKSGNVCGACCPFCFMYMGIPLAITTTGLAFYRKKNDAP